MIKNLIKRALVTLDRTDSQGQCSYLGITSNYETIKPYGIASIPKQSDKPLLIMLNVNGDEGNKAGFEYNNKLPFNAETLKAGEVAVYNPTNNKSYVILKNDGETRLVGTKIALGNPTTELLDQISKLCTEAINDATAASVHTHISSLPGSPSAPPNNAASFTTVVSNITAIKSLIDALKGTI